MPGLVDELVGIVPRLLERTRDQVDLVGRVLGHLPCLSRLVGDSPSESPADDAAPVRLAPVVELRPTAGGATAVSGAATVADLPIPGYDELAASQVIPRLEGLEPDELESVRRYEASNRGRRTILARIVQIQAG